MTWEGKSQILNEKASVFIRQRLSLMALCVPLLAAQVTAAPVFLCWLRVNRVI